MTIPLAPPLLAGSSCQPGRSWAEASLAEVSGGVAPGLRTFPREAPIRHCSGWGLPCRPGCPVRGGLLPHRFTLTMETHGRLFSVALSLGLPPPGVTRHPCFMESGLSSKVAPRGHPAIRALWAYARASLASTGKRVARLRIRRRSVASSGPVTPGRKRSRKAASMTSGATCG